MSRHQVRGRQLSRDTEHRKAMRRNLVQSLFEHGKVRTTLPKAKEVRSLAERMITLAKRADAAGTDAEGKRVKVLCRRRVVQMIQDRRLVDENQDFIESGPTRTVVQRLFNDVAPKLNDRTGGYTRIIKLPKHRIGDAASLVLLQLLTEKAPPAPKGSQRRSAGLRRRRNQKKVEFANRVRKSGKPEPAAEKAPDAAEKA
jgi:large subunit ribosomal protein L17